LCADIQVGFLSAALQIVEESEFDFGCDVGVHLRDTVGVDGGLGVVLGRSQVCRRQSATDAIEPGDQRLYVNKVTPPGEE
jgi:hypothetical protein